MSVTYFFIYIVFFNFFLYICSGKYLLFLFNFLNNQYKLYK